MLCLGRSPGSTIELQPSTELVCVCTCLYTHQHGYLLPCMSELEGCKETLDVKPGWVCGRWQSHHAVCVPFKGGHIAFKRGLFSVPAYLFLGSSRINRIVPSPLPRARGRGGRREGPPFTGYIFGNSQNAVLKSNSSRE